MKIIRFQFEDKSAEWRLEELHLNKLTLLVGASGVGKTQILRALMNLSQISKGSSINGVSWKVEFQTFDKKVYLWEGEFEKKERINFFFGDMNGNINIKKERITLNEKVILERDAQNIFYHNQKTPQLFQHQSAVYLLQNEADIAPIFENLGKIRNVNYSGFSDLKMEFFFQQIMNLIPAFITSYKKLETELKTIADIQESELDINIKLYFLAKKDKKVFGRVKQRFMSIFPNIEDVRVDFVEDTNEEVPEFLRKFPFLQIKEKGVNHWIGQHRISSGMYSTFMNLGELYVCAEGTVFLIDEFENSLGINCINEIMNDILVSTRQLQFILTSHHPYIIDAIGYQNWKLVTRNGGIIKTHNLDKFDIGKSKHSAFMQLLQLEEYQTGQEQIMSETN
jgi:predicted ATPase